MYYNGKRAGHEPTWDYQQATENLKYNKDKSKFTKVVGLYNGSLMVID